MSKQYFKLPILLAALWAMIVLASSLISPAQAARVVQAPAAQVPIFTPTPLPDGRIIYTVKAGESLLSISLLTGVPVDQLRALNNLNNDTIFEGQQLLLGLAGPLEVTPTPGPSPTPTVAQPTPTMAPGSANLCILLFDDTNGDSIRQEEELSLPGGAVSVANRSGSFSETAETPPGTEPYCFEGLDEGDYSISVGVPDGYNPTTVTDYEVQLRAGDETYLDFGAQPNSEMLAEAPTPTGSGRSPLLGIVGGLLVVAGIGFALVASRLLKK